MRSVARSGTECFAGEEPCRNGICSFEEYLRPLKNANKRQEFQSIMKKVGPLNFIREARRSIWTAWKVTQIKLSDKAHVLQRAMTLLERFQLSKPLCTGIESSSGRNDNVALMFRDIVLRKGIHGLPLGYREEVCEHGMRRLVQCTMPEDVLGKAVYGNETASQ